MKGIVKSRDLLLAHAQSGAILVEMCLGLPVVLIFILLFIWYGVTLNASASLSNAIGQSLNVATTRGDATLFGNVPIIDEVEDWLFTNNAGAPNDTLARLLASDDMRTSDQYIFNFNDPKFGAGRPVFGTNINKMPPTYIYALIYMYQNMKMSVGSSLRFPCDPRETDESKGGPGCMQCTFLNPNTLDTTTSYIDNPPTKRIGMQCTYQPSSVILTPLLNLFALISKSDVDEERPPLLLTRKAYMDFSGK